jgi:hypothetical protein
MSVCVQVEKDSKYGVKIWILKNWIHVALDTDQWRALVNRVTNLGR